MARRPHVDSTASAVEIIKAASRRLLPPDGTRLRTCDTPFWEAILASKPRSFWSDEKLAVAAQLARTMADIERVALLDDGTDPDNIVATLGATNKLTLRMRVLRLAIDLKPAAEGDKDKRERRESIAAAIEQGAGAGDGGAGLLN